ncbi:Short chain dehydrogenase [Penicillium riverlandense]|uniref:Short chain dehydrogenase n=1 Tax=Penicillium riverlandense TaxID=1903569 RepID=UPI002548328B|nr:Short chain dehydrogenase [Penicillium riverlandense]KAJ5819419.1 Short chain dehydrogenase [Penicillium riverlandense]
MSYALKGRRALITGGSKGLGKVIAELLAAQGVQVAINYMSNGTVADEVAANLAEQYGIRAITIQAETVSGLGGLDIVIANAAWTAFSDFADLSALSEEEWDKCWATNVKSSLHMFRAAKDTLNANPDGGVYIYTASIAGVSPSGSSMAYSVTKAAGLHLMKCLAQTQGPKIRVNSVIPGLLLTDWGQRYSPEYIQRWRDETSLREVPDVRQCAEIYLSIARNRSMTGQQIEIDCGWLLSH